MDPKLKRKFQVIGACVKTQTTSWDEELKLMDGIPYDINFKQNFSTMYYDGQLIMNLPVSYIIETIDNPEANMIVFDVNNYLPSGEEYRCSIEFKEQFEEFTKKEKKDKQKWKRNKKKRQANTKRLLKEIDNGKFFIKDRR